MPKIERSTPEQNRTKNVRSLCLILKPKRVSSVKKLLVARVPFVSGQGQF